MVHINFSSKGNNILNNTNNLKSRIINDFNFKTKEIKFLKILVLKIILVFILKI